MGRKSGLEVAVPLTFLDERRYKLTSGSGGLETGKVVRY
jgi:hypothetical protein